MSLLITIISFTSIFSDLLSQETSNYKSRSKLEKFDRFFSISDSLDRKKLNTSIIVSTGSYVGFSIGFYHAWYKKFDQEPFHLYNDLGEWRHMDKVGHFYGAYMQGMLIHKGSKWIGLSDNTATWTGFALGSLFQSTLEVMDGFSSKWGFSIPDVAMNFAGSSAFVVQQKVWKEQRIKFKVSNIPKKYSDLEIIATNSGASSSLAKRAENLYGSTFTEKFLKDYNSQIIWAAVDIKSFLPESSNFPKWLNLALGFGAGNMFGGYSNTWNEGPNNFRLNETQYPRYSSIYLAPDINLSNIRSKSFLFNSILDIFDIFKLPLPAIEYNTLGEFHFHFFI